MHDIRRTAPLTRRSRATHTTHLTAVAAFAAGLFAFVPIGAAIAQGGSTDSTHAGHTMPMPPAGGLMDISMARMGSGTTWVPEASPLPSHHYTAGRWSVMAHGFAFGEYNHQGGPRGDDQAAGLNWAMLMASRPLAGGRFEARTMLSVDALTATARGYPLLLQSGEMIQGAPIHDRQHPHDFWMELGAIYERPVTSSLAWSVYTAPAGEPALGPVAFMHRPSAMDNPIAPISHHWQDATHVSFGVATVGLFTSRWRLEASSFNAREPDEHRWNFDLGRLDSYSGRVTFAPTARWTLTGGFGYLKGPERAEPDEDARRATASVMYGAPLASGGQWSSSAIWGANDAHGAWTHSALFEAEAVLDDHNTVFGRAERVEKSGEELVLTGAGIAADQILPVASMSLGYIRELWQPAGATLGLGAMGTLNLVPQDIASTYGSRTPVGAMVFLRLRVRSAGGHDMSHMNGMNMPGMPPASR